MDASYGYHSSVFINCPFDDDFSSILQAILFCIIQMGFNPRIASEQSDSAQNRWAKIENLIESSKYSIHDLSRCEARKKGEISRLNMPFELGYDIACRKHFRGGKSEKSILILEEKAYRYQAALSDISGNDIKHHNADYQKAMRCVRDWLVSAAKATPVAPKKILGAYEDFQEWNWERLLSEGYSEDDIKSLQTVELLDAMRLWRRQGNPTSFN